MPVCCYKCVCPSSLSHNNVEKKFIKDNSLDYRVCVCGCWSLLECALLERIEKEKQKERERAFLAIAEQSCPVAVERFFGSPSVLRSTVSLPFKGIMNQLSQIGWTHTL